MWHWDQGHIEYFDLPVLRVTEAYLRTLPDIKTVKRPALQAATGLDFPTPSSHSIWRNYARVWKSALLLSERAGVAELTPLASRLAQVGAVTSDEYGHFLVMASTEPNPALSGWSATADFRYPLLVVLKYLLAIAIVSTDRTVTRHELIGMYKATGFVGDEDADAFILAAQDRASHLATGQAISADDRRQARESITILGQLSYISISPKKLSIDLAARDARSLLAQLMPVDGPRSADANEEIRRLAGLFVGGTGQTFEYLRDVEQSGFPEGNKVVRTHLSIERNASLRKAYFAANTSAICDICRLDTHLSYPWTERVLELHHLLPLCSGVRVRGSKSSFDDLVALCPNCHRAVHRNYAAWLKQRKQLDFLDRDEALLVYNETKQKFTGLVHA